MTRHAPVAALSPRRYGNTARSWPTTPRQKTTRTEEPRVGGEARQRERRGGQAQDPSQDDDLTAGRREFVSTGSRHSDIRPQHGVWFDGVLRTQSGPTGWPGRHGARTRHMGRESLERQAANPFVATRQAARALTSVQILRCPSGCSPSPREPSLRSGFASAVGSLQTAKATPKRSFG